MTARPRALLRVLLLSVFVVLALPALGGGQIRAAAWAQTPGVPGLDQLAPEERALENYRQFKAMTPEERKTARENFQRFRRLPAPERQRVLEDLRRWNDLPESRRK